MNKPHNQNHDVDPEETLEWVDSLEDVLVRWGPERIRFILNELDARARARGVGLPFRIGTPSVNTIPVDQEPEYPGDVELEERLETLIRWNAMAMVVKANQGGKGLGGHIATYASVCTLYEVGFNHFFRGATDETSGDMVFFQGHSSPGIYARAWLEDRLSTQDLVQFRQELADGGGLSSYPHPWLMPGFWQFPSVSLGLGALGAIYQARFNRYLTHRGFLDTSRSRVWAFLGDGEMDEVESRGGIDIAAREGLDNLTFVVNCNFQRLDGPVRGNTSIVRELETCFRGSGWNVIKVLWSSEWDDLLESDADGMLLRRLERLVDGDLQSYGSDREAMRAHLFDTPELAALVEGWSDEQFAQLRWGGHDRNKVYAAYDAAVAHKGSPTLILAQSVKGWGMGAAGSGKNSTHGVKKLKGDGLLTFRDSFNVPLNDEEASEPAFLLPEKNDAAIDYLQTRRKALGGYVPSRREAGPKLDLPDDAVFNEFNAGTDRPASTTMAFVRLLGKLMRDKGMGKLVVPIIPDEARTFGMESFFREFGIYNPQGQLYEPVDKKSFLYYREAKDGQVLEEGITEAGCMASFIAAGTAYATHGVNTIPFFTYYSMFGFQRVGDSIWAACDARARGFLMGATAGRTTLNGEGLQHQDGQSHLFASVYPNLRAYEPAYAYETAVLVRDGIHRMYELNEPWIYYITLQNENYIMPPMPGDADVTSKAIVDGLYRIQERDSAKAQLFGSGSILPGVLAAATILEEQYGVPCDVWSATSYKQLRTDALAAEHWNRLHPGEAPRSCHLWDVLSGVSGPFVAASDNVALVPELVSPWFGEGREVNGRLWALGTDGFGRSDTRARLRRHFEVDTESVVLATLHAVGSDAATITKAMADLGLNPEQQNSFFV
jgi:pyruvate dehydrogenase E1 component